MNDLFVFDPVVSIGPNSKLLSFVVVAYDWAENAVAL